MTNLKAAPWIIGASFLALLIAGGAWFFLVSPALEDAASYREQTTETLDRNEMLRAQNRVLAEQFANIEQYRAQLATLRVGVPETIDQETVVEIISDVAASSEAFIADLTFQTSVELVDPNPLLGDEALAYRAPSGFFGLPFEITIAGSPQQTFEFVDSLQHSDTRLFLVSAVDITGQEESGATGGRPEVKEGDAEIVVKGFVYILDGGAGGSGTEAVEGGTPGAVAN